MRKTTRFATLSGMVLVVTLWAASASAQLNSNVADVAINAHLAESLQLSTDVNTVNFNLVPAGLSNTQTVTVTSDWVLRPNRGTVSVVAYFDSTAPLVNSADATATIASADITGQVNGGAATPFSETNILGPAGASLLLFSEGINGTNKHKTRSDTLGMQIDLSSVPQTAAGDYTGTLHIQAQAF